MDDSATAHNSMWARIGVTGPAIVAIGVFVAVVWLSPWGRGAPTVRASFDMPIYTSIQELASAADAVVVGTVVGVTGREADHGTALAEERVGDGLPVVFYAIDVSEILKGQTGPTIIVGNADGERLPSPDVTPLSPGERVLLFLRLQTKEDAPGVTLYESFYAPLSLDNGIFDLTDKDLAYARMPEAFGSADTEVAPGVSQTAAFKLADIRNEVGGD